ncbi:hypothetical protein F5Y04DRAFT_289781 [Hypomontagnella monticulosa]|nr:hypothetical protein F5Y04DRAFT_289781 [Hypomontagnella monticulosa]
MPWYSIFQRSRQDDEKGKPAGPVVEQAVPRDNLGMLARQTRQPTLAGAPHNPRPKRRGMEYEIRRIKRTRRCHGVPRVDDGPSVQELHPLQSCPPMASQQRSNVSGRDRVEPDGDSNQQAPQRPYFELTDEERREADKRCIEKAPYMFPDLFLLRSRDSFDEESIMAARGIKCERKPHPHFGCHIDRLFQRPKTPKQLTLMERFERYQQRRRPSSSQPETPKLTMSSSNGEGPDTPQDAEPSIPSIKNIEPLPNSTELPVEADYDNSRWEDPTSPQSPQTKKT